MRVTGKILKEMIKLDTAEKLHYMEDEILKSQELIEDGTSKLEIEKKRILALMADFTLPETNHR